MTVAHGCFDWVAPHQTRIVIEAEAVLGIIDRIESGEVELLGSAILQLETEESPNPVGRRFALDVRGLASRQVEVDGEIESAARMYSPTMRCIWHLP